MIMNDYWEALDRLIKERPVNVSKSSAINKDTVALEAGRKRGSIKKSREKFSELIAAIETASADKASKTPSLRDLLNKERELKSKYQERYHEAINRELMLVDRLACLEKELKKPRKVTPINK